MSRGRDLGAAAKALGLCHMEERRLRSSLSAVGTFLLGRSVGAELCS